MKKTLVSLAAVAAISTGAMAADKGVDLTTTGQAVIYYETKQNDAVDIFNQAGSQANAAIQLNIGGDLGNGYTLGSQLSYIGTLGLEKNLVSGTKQTGGALYATTDELALSKIFVAKQVGNTTLKMGRQELPKSLSPLAFSEGWNVFKNTFEAIVAINTDIKDTTLVGAYVGKANSTLGTGLSAMNDLTAGGLDVTKGAYMLTVANKSLPMTALTASYYTLHGIDLTSAGGDANGNSASAMWIDAKVAGKDMPLGLSVGLQGGSIMLDLADASTLKDTTAMGVKVALKPVKDLMVQVAYSSVDDGAVGVKNTGTGVKTPLFTQMIYNQNAIASDADTIVVKGAYNMGDMGKFIAQYGMTTDNANNNSDYNELDLIYKVKSAGVTYWASVMMIDVDAAGDIIGSATEDSDTKLRLWARLNF
ncbi:MAG: hypothetical protein OQJ77_07540 [Thiovulaceae bacterium]|nr:hypothetical protein [Sulfurimonadaceae bacterium]